MSPQISNIATHTQLDLTVERVIDIAALIKKLQLKQVTAIIWLHFVNFHLFLFPFSRHLVWKLTVFQSIVEPTLSPREDIRPMWVLPKLGSLLNKIMKSSFSLSTTALVHNHIHSRLIVFIGLSLHEVLEEEISDPPILRSALLLIA